MAAWLETVFAEILGRSMDVAVVILCLLCVRAIVVNYSGKYAYLLWSVVAVRLMWVLPVENPFSFFQLPFFTGHAWQAVRQIPEGLGMYAAAAAGDNAAALQPAEPAAGLSVWQGILPAAAFVWVAGMLAFLLYFLISYIRTGRQVRFAVQVEPSVYQGDCVASPFVMGVLRPRIYLPAGLDAEAFRHVLCHERQHVRRRDPLVKLLAFGLLAVYWFHPLVWVSYVLFCRDMEMSCDEAALQELGMEEKKAYSRTLLAFASGRAMPANLLGFRESHARERICHILRFRKPGAASGALLLLILLLSLVVWGCAGSDGGQGEAEGTVSEQAEALYEAAVPYVGDASAVGNLLDLLRQQDCLPDQKCTLELQTEEEPYGFVLGFREEEASGETMDRLAYSGTLLLALIGNLEEIQWEFPSEDGESMVTYYWDEASAQAMLPQADDLKAYGKSARGVEELLDLLEDAGASSGTEDISVIGGADGPTDIYLSEKR